MGVVKKRLRLYILVTKASGCCNKTKAWILVYMASGCCNNKKCKERYAAHEVGHNVNH